MPDLVGQVPPVNEESLDPEDWPAFRALAHRMVDDMLDSIATLRDRPVWQAPPDRVRAAMNAPLPLEGEAIEDVYEAFKRDVLPYPAGNAHPRFWGWVMGGGTPLGMMADMLAAGMNPNLGGRDHAAVLVERQVVAWCAQALGFPAATSGLLVSGGSMANLVGLAVARNARGGPGVREEGLWSGGAPLTLYGSAEMHSSIQKAVEVLGIGNRWLRRVPVDEGYRVRPDLLRAAIREDLAAGLRPLAVIGCAGTVNSGAMDPLEDLADIAAEHGLWLHVDGAFGALAALAPDLRPLVRGMERADSLAFDLHKWGYQPFEVGCALVRDEQAHRAAFSLTPAYLKHAERGLAAGSAWFSDYGIQLSREFRALKVWMAFRAHGLNQIGRVIRQNVEQARYLAALVTANPDLELLAPVGLNIVCFRYRADGLSGEALNRLNEELLLRLQESGTAVISGTTLRGDLALRCAITNHRSQRADFDALVANVRALGEALTAEQRGATSHRLSSSGG